MDISLSELKEKEIVNVFDGKKLGRIIDILFNIENGMVKGIVVPGEKKFFKKSEDIFIPLEKLKKIGDDVVLVKLSVQSEQVSNYGRIQTFENKKHSNRYEGYGASGRFGNYYENGFYNGQNLNNRLSNNQSASKESFVRFKPINNKKYK